MKFISLKNLTEAPTYHGNGKKKILIPPNQIPNLHQFGRTVFQPGEAVSPHNHPEFAEVIYIEEGDGRMKVNDDTFKINPGDCIIVEPGEAHEIFVNTPQPMAVLFFGILK